MSREEEPDEGARRRSLKMNRDMLKSPLRIRIIFCIRELDIRHVVSNEGSSMILL